MFTPFTEPMHIYNPFVNRYYVDDKYGVVKERTPHKEDPCR